MESSALPHAEDYRAIERWLFKIAIPFWTQNGRDIDSFAFEEFGFDGKPRELGYRRSLVQFRQIYVLARAAITGYGPQLLPAELFERVAAIAWHKSGGFIHKLRLNGLTGDTSRNSYDQAFGMLAAAWVYLASRKQTVLDHGYQTLRFLDEAMMSSYGGYVEQIPSTGRLRRQNPHMHLFEAFLALYEATGDDLFLKRAETILELLDRYFVAETGALREYFDDEWHPVDPSIQTVEPGHHYEWVWLLHEYARLTGEPIHPLASQLFDFAELYGLNARRLPVAQVALHGAQQITCVKLWAVTEQLKARIARAEASQIDFDPQISGIVNELINHFLLTQPPLWFEELAPDGTPVLKRMPASTLYHITAAGAELLRWRSASASAEQM